MGLTVFSAPQHKLTLVSSLLQGDVVMGVRPSLPMGGIQIILGNDLAGDRVWPGSPISQVEETLGMSKRTIPPFRLCTAKFYRMRSSEVQPVVIFSRTVCWFPKDKDMRKKWEVALRREGFTASESSVICSEHCKQDEFDRTGQIVRLRDGVIPSIFSFPVHLQRPEKGRTTSTSRKAEESLSVAPQDDPEASHSQPHPNDIFK
ncbi:uncharacterized protein [Pseudochaenichthys georgianus]|uniref:uncharacterized protein isoform X2 n=1 Tax=Pseudochaenichthys georgianus TaxID=52239 RepID=UPI0039C0B636